MKRRIAKKMQKNLINKKALKFIIAHSNICRHAKAELKRAGYGKGEGGPNDWIYEQVMEAVAVFSSHDNSGSSAPFEINFVKKLCSWDIISPLRFTDDEWHQISKDGTCQNTRISNVFKEPNGLIHYNEAFAIRPTGKFSFYTKQWTKNERPICWIGGLFEHKNNILTGRYFRICQIWSTDITNGWTPKERIDIDCVEVEIAPNSWLMAVDKDNNDLLLLECYYNIKWIECPCLKDVRLEDVTQKLEDKACEEIRRNSNN